MSHGIKRFPSPICSPIGGALAFFAALLLFAADVRADCKSDAECKGARICQNGACVDAPATQGCKKDVDCPGDQVCTAGVCSGGADTSPAQPPQAPPSAAPPDPEQPTQYRRQPAHEGDRPPPRRRRDRGGFEPEEDEMTDEYGRPIYKKEKKPITGLIIAGPIVFGVAYVLGISVTAALEADGDLIGYSAIPVLGPWIMVADDRTGDYTAALVIDGILQAGGVTMFIVGMTVRKEKLVPIRAGDVSMGISVLPLPGGGAISVGGEF